MTVVKGKVQAVNGNVIVGNAEGPVLQNAIAMVQLEGKGLMSEVIKIAGERIYMQCFENTRGLGVNDEIEYLPGMLEVTLGPGMLSRIYDGLQHDLEKLDGIFLNRGDYAPALDDHAKWEFTPTVNEGDWLQAGDWLGYVIEQGFKHRIMLPFSWQDKWQVKSLTGKNTMTIHETVATLANAEGEERTLTMVQKWPVKWANTCYREKVRPSQIMETGIRVIDSLNPIMLGGTGFIPGAFGTGKTVLQQGISRQADADIIIIAACGERANEVVDTFYEFAHLVDARTGKLLKERTIIIANTSNMPVAAREASVYTAMAIAEYYRNMGLRVLLLADSTSRWAQAMRETSNRLEELPGPDAFPMDLTAVVANFYARAGIVYLSNGEQGSITFIGTVSPAGGNMKEPVTEATKKVARCFYALSQKRADQKRYPAVDPIESYSKYLEYPEVIKTLSETISLNWTAQIAEAKDLLRRGREATDQINILGDDGVPLEYHIRQWKGELIDFILLQQDAFDAVDCLTPLIRQKDTLDRLLRIAEMEFAFDGFEEIASYFKGLINLLKQLNYAEYKSEKFSTLESEIEQYLDKKRVV